MSYQLSAVTIRADNSPQGLAAIGQLWEDVQSGKLPLLFDNEGEFQPGISPISRYSNYDSDQSGSYDLTVMTVTSVFFSLMEKEVVQGAYRKYHTAGKSLTDCTREAWEQVWQDGSCKRAFTTDYESSVPAEYGKDGMCHCYLYIAVKE